MLTTASIVIAAPLMLVGIPPAFSDLTYERAIAANAASEGLLVVKFTAAWCGPCKVMDRTTWSDEAVVAYLKEHGVTAIPVDVDEHGAVARDNRVSAMPTMVAYRGGSEVDRVVGGMDAASLTDWLDDVRAGRTRAAALRERAGERAGPDGTVDVQERLGVARGFAGTGEYAEASAEYVWLWENMLDHDESMTGVRVSFMAGEMKALAAEDPGARRAFKALRDGLGERMASGETSRGNLSDWIVLNIRVLDDHDAVQAWLDRIWERPTGKRTVRAMAYLLSDWMIERGQWARLGEAQLPVSAMLFQERSTRAATNDFLRENPDVRMAEFLDERYADDFAVYHASCLAAGREEEAWQAADALLADLDTPASRAALCRRAIEAGCARERHLEFAGAVEGEEGERLVAALREALGADR